MTQTTSVTNQRSTTKAYRPDIDGLRALAVGLVILHHLDFKGVDGGYIGVDVFFVISGYLITSIIFPAILEKRFSFAGFFSRRVKRLSPMLSIVVLTSCLAGLFLFLPSDLEILAKSAIWVSMFGGNIFFWRNYGGYFAEDSQQAPLLHTWSLAVEEQYYLLWPLGLLLSIRLLGPRNTIVLICLSLPALVYLSELGTRMTIGAAYYLLPTRMFELLAGSTIAALRAPDRLQTSYGAASLIGCAGLGLIIFAGLSLSPASTFPGYNALWPVIGTSLVILTANGLANHLLSFQIFVYLGKLSYSLYLWHWPVIAFLHYSGTKLSIAVSLVALGVTVILAIVSYHLIENPLRLGKYKSRRQIFTLLYLLPTTVTVFLSLAILHMDGLPYRFTAQLIVADQAVAARSHREREACHSPARYWKRAIDDSCYFGAQNTLATTILLTGDSHANHLVPFMNVLAEDAGANGNDYSMDRCPPLFGISYGPNPQIADQCKSRNELVRASIKHNSYRYVVISSSWPDINTKALYDKDGMPVDSSEVEGALNDALRLTLDTIISSGAVPILVRETPHLIDTSPRCSIQKEVFNSKLDCRATLHPNRWLENNLKVFQEEYESLDVIDPFTTLCDERNACAMIIEDLPLFMDDNHLNARGSALLAKTFLETHENPFTNNSSDQDQGE